MSESRYEQCVAGVDRECEELVTRMVGMCPWMGADEVTVLRRLVACHMALVYGEREWDATVEVMLRDTLMLARRAREVGDDERRWAFEQWHAWGCASLCGEEYVWQEWLGNESCPDRSRQ